MVDMAGEGELITGKDKKQSTAETLSEDCALSTGEYPNSLSNKK